MRLHAPLFPLAVCLAAGIALSDLVPQWTVALALLVPTVGAVSLMGRYPRSQTFGIFLCAVLTGMTLGTRQRQALEVEWPEDAVTTEVVVINEPTVKDRWVVADVETATGHQKLRCHITRNEVSECIQVGDGLSLTTRIDKIHEWHRENFSYRRYMLCHGFVGETFVYDGQWEWRPVKLTGLSVVERVRLRFLRWRHSLLEQYRQWGLADKSYGVIAAITLGDKSQLDATVRETFARVGASHILALSGLHLMTVYAVISLLVGWRRFQLPSQVLTVLAVWAFALLTGLSASVVRSAFMISVYALLSLGHRERMSVNTLAFPAIVMLVVNPFALYDVGFQLSFMAVLTILLFNPLFYRAVPLHVQQRHRWLNALWAMVSVSLSAQLGTAPLVAYYFGRFSTYFLLSNFIVIPLTTFILYLALLGVALCYWSVVSTSVAAVLSAAVTLMAQLLQLVGSLPYSSIEGLRVNMRQLPLLYLVILCVYVLLTLKINRVAVSEKLSP